MKVTVNLKQIKRLEVVRKMMMMKMRMKMVSV